MHNMNKNYKYIIASFVLNTVLHHVGMSWTIETNKQLKYDMEKQTRDGTCSGYWYNTYICKKIHGTVFEEFSRSTRTHRYNFMCSIDAHKKQNPSYIDDGNIGGGNVLPSNSTTEALVSLSTNIDLIDCWLKSSEQNSLEHSNMYFEIVECMF